PEDYVQAENACRAALALDPEDTQALLLLGEIVDREVRRGFRKAVSAIEPLKRAIEIKPDCPDLYAELGNAYRIAYRYDEAVAAYNTDAALRRRQERLEQHGDAYSAQHEKDRQLSDAITIAGLCSKTGKYEQALESLQHAEILAPHNDLIHFDLGKTYLGLGDTESAKREQELVMEACGSKEKYLVDMCESYAKELREAIQKSR
ncbi:MAG TPA: tetratricopeptide repeat protein, partial [Blastocatellia bacterium]|nr:tetratricopeptide repeat protein [Blastocatellia bacterium]